MLEDLRRALGGQQPHLAERLDSAKWWTRMAAVCEVGELPTMLLPQHRDKILELLHDEQWRVRAKAVWALGRDGGQLAIHHENVLALLDDDEPAVRVEAARAIASLDALRQRYADELTMMLLDPSWFVRRFARAKIATALLPPKVSPWLVWPYAAATILEPLLDVAEKAPPTKEFVPQRQGVGRLKSQASTLASALNRAGDSPDWLTSHFVRRPSTGAVMKREQPRARGQDANEPAASQRQQPGSPRRVGRRQRRQLAEVTL